MSQTHTNSLISWCIGVHHCKNDFILISVHNFITVIMTYKLVIFFYSLQLCNLFILPTPHHPANALLCVNLKQVMTITAVPTPPFTLKHYYYTSVVLSSWLSYLCAKSLFIRSFVFPLLCLLKLYVDFTVFTFLFTLGGNEYTNKYNTTTYPFQDFL